MLKMIPDIIIYSLLTLLLAFIAFIILNKKKSNFINLIIDILLSFFIIIFFYRFLNLIFINYFLKYIILLIYIFNVIYVLVINIKKKISIKRKVKYNYFKIIILFIFIIINLLLFYGIFPNEKPIDLEFPLENGSYFVLQGGKFPFYNYGHYIGGNNNNYSMDVLKMNKLGFVTNKLFTNKYSDHIIYDEPVYSPCDGKVIKIINTKKDGPNKHLGKANNQIRISYNCYIILLAHFKKDSFLVNVGDYVKKGEKLGLTASTGCHIPHLHIQVYKNNKSRPFTFNNKFYYNNCVIKRL